MSSLLKSRTFRRCRTAFRWVRITVWFAAFLAVAAAAYLHLLGLPDFLKRPLLSRLRERGFEAQFTSARLGWGSEVVIENASFQRPEHPFSPKLSAAQTQVRLNWQELIRRRFKVDALRIQQGKLEVPVPGAIGGVFAVNDVSLAMALLPHDTIQIEAGSANFHGMHIELAATVTNFTVARDWNFWTGPTNQTPAPPPATGNSLQHFARILNQIYFVATPQLTVKLSADGNDPDSVRSKLTLRAPGARTPWGAVQNLSLAANCDQPMNPGPGPFLNVRLTAGEFSTPQGAGRNLYLTVQLAHSAATNLQAALNFAVTNFQLRLPAPNQTNSIAVARLDGKGTMTLQEDSLAFTAAGGTLRGESAQTPWGAAASAEASVRVAAVEGSPDANPGWGVWAAFDRRAVEWEADLGKVSNPRFQIERLRAAGRWRAPELVLTNLDASLYGGAFHGRAGLDVGARELVAGANLDFDTRRLAALLAPAAQEWMAQFDWDKPPRVEAEARMILPPWTNRPPDWWDAVLPTLQIAGDFSVGPASYRRLPVTAAQSRFTYTNQIWDLPRLRAVRPEGELYLDYNGSEATEDYLFMVDSTFDPGIVRPLLPEKQRPLLDEAGFSTPPEIHAQIRGNWRDGGKTAVDARVAATNFTAHGEKVDRLTAAVQFTNLQMRVSDGHLWKDGGELIAPRVDMDFRTQKISISNAVSTLDARRVTRAIGPLAPGWLNVIGFDTPPTVQLSGSFVPDDDLATDLHFAVSGRNFRYTNAVAGQMSGEVNWKARSVAMTNVQGTLYGGALNGWGVFDYTEAGDTDFRGQFTLAKIELPLVVKGLSTQTNHIEGVLDGHLAITGGNSRDKRTWVAHGDVAVNKAMLWDIKIFGVFSSLLNAISPGAGNSRAYQANANFVVTNALVATDNLEIRSTHLRLVYRGTLNSDKVLDARVEARPLRDAPIVGPLFFSWALSPLDKMFEYKIGGTLDSPTYKPLYMPKFLMLLLRPFHTLKEFLPPSESPTPPEPQKAGATSPDPPKTGK